MKWIAASFMWLSAAAVTIAAAMLLGPVGRVSVVWVALGSFAAAAIGTVFVAEANG